MKHIKLYEFFEEKEDFYYYKPEKGEEVIIRNDTIGSRGTIPSSDLASMLDRMGGPDEIITNFNVLSSKEPFKINFAMNACLFEPGGKNTGLFVFYNREIIPLSKQIRGNFGQHLDSNSSERNGVFYGDGFKWDIIGSSKYTKSLNPKFAIQNGPILALDGKMNSVFKKNSKNKDYRNGIGVDSEGVPYFVCSKKNDCTFWDLSNFFLDSLGCVSAIYSDGVISQCYSRDQNLYTNPGGGSLGPLILVATR